MEPTFLQSIARRLKVARIESGYSQRELAEKTGLTQQLLSIYEKGMRSIRIDQLWKIANACNVSVYFFFTDSEESVELVRLVENMQPKFR